MRQHMKRFSRLTACIPRKSTTMSTWSRSTLAGIILPGSTAPSACRLLWPVAWNSAFGTWPILLSWSRNGKRRNADQERSNLGGRSTGGAIASFGRSALISSIMKGIYTLRTAGLGKFTIASMADAIICPTPEPGCNPRSNCTSAGPSALVRFEFLRLCVAEECPVESCECQDNGNVDQEPLPEQAA